VTHPEISSTTTLTRTSAQKVEARGEGLHMAIPTDQYELYAEYGITAEKAQILEVEAGNAALAFLALFVSKDQEIDAEQREFFRSIVDEVNRKTLGCLLKCIKSLVTCDESILQVVDEALEKRNYLSHHFFRTHNFAIFDAEGRKAMVAELKCIQSKLDHAHGALSVLSPALLTFSGRSGMTEKHMALLLSQAKRVEI
jgi:hypothetical protein